MSRFKLQTTVLFLFFILFSNSLFAIISLPNSQGHMLYYSTNDSSKTATLITPVDGAGYKYASVDIPEYINSGGTKYEVSVISREVFKGCDQLIEITIPRTIKSIGRHAFKDCYNLATVKFNANSCISASERIKNQVYSAFEDCTSITNVSFGDHVTYIPEHLFWGCSGILEVTIPENVTHIAGGAFIDCTSLTTLRFNAINCVSMTSINGESRTMSAFVNTPISTIIFGNLVKNIPAYAFFGLKGLFSIEIPKSVEMMGGAAFRECTNLTTVIFNAENCRVSHTVESERLLPPFNNPSITKVQFGDNVEIIPNYLFWGCSGLQSVDFTDHISEIGESAFYGCSSLTSVVIPEGITVIKGGAFESCSNLSTVYFNAVNCVNMTSLDNDKILPAFDRNALTQVYFGKSVQSIPDNAFLECTYLTAITLPEKLQYIGYKAFYGCTSLRSIIIPEKVEQIGGLAFAQCKNLSSVEFNAYNCQGVTKLEDGEHLSAFHALPALKSVKFGNKVTAIPNYIFAECLAINKVVIPENIKSIGGYAFVGCSSLNNIEYNAIDCRIVCSTEEDRMRSAFANQAVTTVTFGKRVKNIPEYAFSGCERLVNVNLPDSLEVIEKYAFADCKSLRYITIPERVKNVKGGAFAGCTNLRDIDFNAIDCQMMVTLGDTILPAFASESVYRIKLGANVKNVPDYAFYKCSAVESVIFNKELETIGKFAFADAKSLYSIMLPEKLLFVGGGAFSNCKQLTSVTYNSINCAGAFEVGTDSIIYPFDGENKIKEVTIGKKVERIPEGMFFNSKRLSSVTIPKKIVELGAYAFGNCKELTTLKFLTANCENVSGVVNDTVRSAFEGCEKLVNITLDGKMTFIPDYMFQNCAALRRIELPEKIERIGNYAFKDCKMLQRFKLPSKTTTIGDGAFMESGLTSLSIHENIKDIGEGVFVGCMQLGNVSVKKKNEDYIVKNGILYTSDFSRLIVAPAARIAGKVVIDEATYSIDAYAFAECEAISDLVLPKGLRVIGEKAFWNCTLLKVVEANSVSAPTVSAPIFSDKSKIDLFIPQGSAGSYNASEHWRGFKSVVEK
ncbi:MAG: leucine-rich repeat domain-containing protein [bacterium]